MDKLIEKVIGQFSFKLDKIYRIVLLVLRVGLGGPAGLCVVDLLDHAVIILKRLVQLGYGGGHLREGAGRHLIGGGIYQKDIMIS